MIPQMVLPSKATARREVERLLHLQFIRGCEHGHRDCTDIERSGCRIAVVFDVGANVGQSAEKFANAFPDAQIHSFEPVAGTFRTLQRALSKRANVRCHRVALGSREGETTLYLTGAPDANSVTNSLIKPPKSVGSETVELCTVDKFAGDADISRVDLLKVDAEGFDLEVLIGARRLLSSQKVAFVLAEVGFHPGDKRHVLFDDVRSYLIPFGFSVFGFYEQTPEWSGEPRLRFANVCFANAKAFVTQSVK